MTDVPWEVNPLGNRGNIPLKQGFTIQFRQTMDQAATEAALSITETPSGEKVPLEYSWDKPGTTVVFTPTVQMALMSSYLLKLDSSAQALGGGSLDQGMDWHFSTVSPPGIAYIDPADGSIQSEFNAAFTIHFNSERNSTHNYNYN
jgi:hypothetical protein